MFIHGISLSVSKNLSGEILIHRDMPSTIIMKAIIRCKKRMPTFFIIFFLWGFLQISFSGYKGSKNL